MRTGTTRSSQVRSAILESWERCRNSHVQFDQGKCWDLISGRELEQRRGLLCEISEPIMETLHQCVRGSGFIIMLVNRDGYILASLGDLPSLRQAEKLNFGPGANWSEGSVGTNAIGMALAIGLPSQVTGTEHYCESHHAWTCAATPIRDSAGRIIGVLDISGPREKANFHSLGMIVAVGGAIEERLRLEHSHDHYLNMSKHLANVFNSVSESLITIDNQGHITGINMPAARLLNLQPHDLVGKPIDEILLMDQRLRSFLHEGCEYAEEELLFRAEKGRVRCIGSANAICGENNSRLGAVFTFTRMKETRVSTGAGVTGTIRFLFKDIIGDSPVIRETLEKAKRFARGASTILLLGESGTGKELFAQAIHKASRRSNAPFVSVSCGAIPAELIQSELFGYADGAFTGAKKGGRPGKLEQANGGSIFLDEIGEMPLPMQVNLLRVLEERAVVRVGDNTMIPVDVRIIAATNRSLYEEVSRGRFREDLFYRLNVISVIIPPLRERTGDISLLTRHLVDTLSLKMGKHVRSIEPAVLVTLEGHRWPGNVRELANVIEYAINMLQGNDLLLAHLPSYLQTKQSAKPILADAEILPLDQVEKRAIQNALIHFGYNISKTAHALNIGRNTLYEKMKKYGIRA